MTRSVFFHVLFDNSDGNRHALQPQVRVSRINLSNRILSRLGRSNSELVRATEGEKFRQLCYFPTTVTVDVCDESIQIKLTCNLHCE